MFSVEIDPGWERLPSTDAGAYYRLEPDLVLAVPRSDFQQTEEAAKRSLAAFDRIAHGAGRKQAIVVLVGGVVAQESGARRVWSTPRPDETRCAQALVCDTMLARAIGSFFLGLRKTAFPTQMFADLDSAREWAREMAAEHGGAL
ncbi:MAG: hypothetical protein PVJ49_05795 [Acidobacteriota bacterium]|jgi:hypothetical protein